VKTSSAQDALCGADPSEFVALRKRLAAELRRRGKKARRSCSPRRPSTSAWALNQMARNRTWWSSSSTPGTELVAARTHSPAAKDGMRGDTRAH
jgi:hypothetical protein